VTSGRANCGTGEKDWVGGVACLVIIWTMVWLWVGHYGCWCNSIAYLQICALVAFGLPVVYCCLVGPDGGR